MTAAELTALAERLEHMHADGLSDEDYADFRAAARVVWAMAYANEHLDDFEVWVGGNDENDRVWHCEFDGSTKFASGSTLLAAIEEAMR